MSVHIYSIGSYLNLGVNVATAAISFGIAYGINKLAHNVFNCKNVYASMGIRAVGFAAGLGAAVLVAKHVPLISYSPAEIGFYLALDAIILLVSLATTKTFLSSFISPGALIGWIGRPVVVVSGLAGATAGSLFE